MLEQKYSVEVPEYGITFETGSIAKQANGAVTVRLGETTIFVAAVAANKIREGQDFFPLQVDYRERFSAAGRMPGGFFKREGRPSEKEILTSRLCDRPLRPLFPKGFMNEVQVQALLLTTDVENEPDVLVVNGASAALVCSDIPWHGPVACIRLGLIDDEFVVNPTHEQMFDSELDLIYVGNEKEMMMIEGSAEELPDEKFIEALEFAQQAIQPIIKAQKELAALCAKEKKTFDLFVCTPENLKFVRELVGDKLAAGIFQDSKAARQAVVDGLKKEAAEAMKARDGDAFQSDQIMLAFEVLQEELYRSKILDEGKRVDGRGPADLRTITAQAGVLPRVHGSALFQRGETQNIALTTLAARGDTQEMDGLTGGPREKSFILHYNFPNYSVGETGRIMGPGRREIGHGALAERSLLPVLPAEDEFPYVIRVVSEIMESNGSTSMASVCGGCLALMDAGVPITNLVAGISCGLVSRLNEDGTFAKHVVLSDILGAEDHFGDMDFKICGTKDGITGFQLDLKIQGLPHDVAVEAILRNRELREQILAVMAETLPEPRKELSKYAPRIETIQIDPDKIGMLIGPGGKTIRKIVEVSGAQIDIDDDNSGKVYVYATSGESMARAVEEINLITADLEEGKIYRGIVRGIKEFGAFVECLPGKEGLVHISELADFRVRKTEDVCAMGDEMWVKCIGVEANGKVRLSRVAAVKELEGKEDGISAKVAAAKERSATDGGGDGERRERRDRGDRDRGGRDRDRGGRDRDRGGRGGDRDRGGRDRDRGGRDRDRGERGGERGERGGERGEEGERPERSDDAERAPRTDDDERPRTSEGERPERGERGDRPRRRRRRRGDGEGSESRSEGGDSAPAQEGGASESRED
jgi:polyribonucleotide nucleotidyltransferase